ncbi:hypothetical protein NEDG_01917 [Nematocida displodere]|uniref:Adenylate cyclase-associated CAP C-terminal domain-containing protein n=1 Tax=Nematocida displodere TaxID=1805483 RepID=A0A177EGQ3_9MICR|nr:hypothetical protein NEDG_01917 [Nematocida displodere]
MNQQNIIEVRGLRAETKTIDVEPGKSVYIADSEGACILLRGKSIKVVIIDVKDCAVAVESVISNLEMVRGKSTLVVLGKGGMVNIENCVECALALVPNNCEIRLRRNTSVSLAHLPGLEIGSMTIEEIRGAHAAKAPTMLPDEIKVEFSSGESKYTVVNDY